MQPVVVAFPTHTHFLKNIRIQSRQYQTFTNVGGKMLQRLHYISVYTKPQQLIQIQTLCVFEISHCLNRTFPMQIVCQHIFVYIKTQMVTLFSFNFSYMISVYS